VNASRWRCERIEVPMLKIISKYNTSCYIVMNPIAEIAATGGVIVMITSKGHVAAGYALANEIAKLTSVQLSPMTTQQPMAAASEVHPVPMTV
jgi:heptaprenylglyceryl phosphate synthase